MAVILSHICFILFYLSLVYELIFVNIPSVVSTKKILNPNSEAITNFSSSTAYIFNWSYLKKVIVFVLPLLFSYILYLLPIAYLFNWLPCYKSTGILLFIGLFLIVLGRVIGFWFLFQVKKSINKKLITHGVFSISRNPCQLGLYISFLGFFIVYPTLLLLVCFGFYFLHIHFKILLEEDFLSQKFGSDYINYKKNTRRYI